MTGQPIRMLLVEPQFVLRRTIVTVARDLAKVEFQEATGIDRARVLLAGEACRGLVLDLHEGPKAMELVDDVRLGRFKTAQDVLVVALAAQLSDGDAARLRALGVTQVLRKPFKIGDLLTAIGV